MFSKALQLITPDFFSHHPYIINQTQNSNQQIFRFLSIKKLRLNARYLNVDTQRIKFFKYRKQNEERELKLECRENFY